jgi:hypothetical protein
LEDRPKGLELAWKVIPDIPEVASGVVGEEGPAGSFLLVELLVMFDRSQDRNKADRTVEVGFE